MFAVFIENNTILGYKLLDYVGEEDSFLLPYRLYDTLPPEVISVSEGHIVRFEPDTDSFYCETIPPHPVPEPDRISQLEAENFELKLALAKLAEAQQIGKLDVQLALAELTEVVTGGNILWRKFIMS